MISSSGGSTELLSLNTLCYTNSQNHVIIFKFFTAVIYLLYTKFDKSRIQNIVNRNKIHRKSKI